MKRAFLYAGQGSQKPGMGTDFYEEYPEYRRISDSIRLSFDHQKMMREGSEEDLKRTEFTQPCMAVFAAGVTEILLQHDIYPDAAAGLSLGEYGALYAANVWDAQTYAGITEFRGRAMAKAAIGQTSSMSALIGLTAEQAETACEKSREAGFVTVVNYNCPGQYVICGEEDAVQRAEAEAKELGAKRCIRLAVSAPFHTRLLQSASEELGEYLTGIPFNAPEIPVAMNVTGKYLEAEEGSGMVDTLQALLRRQAMSSVHFEDDLRTLMEDGVEEFIEIGPGNALSGFCKKSAKAWGYEVKITSIQTVKDIRKYLSSN